MSGTSPEVDRKTFPRALPVSERHIEPVNVLIDGIEVPGLHIDTDPHVYAVGADLRDRVLTAVVARALFITRM